MATRPPEPIAKGREICFHHHRAPKILGATLSFLFSETRSIL